MKIGVVYPQTEFGNDPHAIRDYAIQAESLGYQHILAYDHVLGANPNRKAWQGPYTYKTPFQEPFVLFSYWAGVTHSIEFTSGIIILPQRQIALVAKQTATLDVLSGGRLRLGVGIGWNEVEYICLGENFHNRGKRIEEQIIVLRELWRNPLVTYSGKWHVVPDAGINPLPVRKSIPIWMGGHAQIVLKRAAFLADGWMPNYRTPQEASSALSSLKDYLNQAGRSEEDFGIEFRISYVNGSPALWHKIVNEWGDVGATHFSLNTMGCGFDKPQEHLKALQTFAQEFDLTST